jgi:hypothetical protein
LISVLNLLLREAERERERERGWEEGERDPKFI